jgi:hypothetical protein
VRASAVTSRLTGARASRGKAHHGLAITIITCNVAGHEEEAGHRRPDK